MAGLFAACSPYQAQTSRPELNVDSSAGIIGGNLVTSSDAVSKITVGLVFIAKDEESICTGTLIERNVILTAAHCVVDTDGGVAVFDTDLTRASNHRKAHVKFSKIWVHPSYDPEAEFDSHDLALIMLRKPAPVGYEVAELLQKTELLQKNLPVILAGYGASSGTNGELSGDPLLRQIQVPLDNPSFSKTEISFDSSQGKGACHGDSGGPALASIEGKLTLIGVTSRTTDQEGGCHKDSVYTNVAPYIDVIKLAIQTMREHGKHSKTQ